MLSATEFAHRPRIIGTETEYSHPKNGQDLTDTGVARQLCDQFVANGGRRYVDIGEIVEFATPECLGPKQAVLYERAGERLVSELDDSAIHKRMVASGVNVYNDTLRSAGHHESYLSTRDVEATALDTVLLVHCASRIAFNGAGLVAVDWKGRPFFSIGQKVWGLHYAINNITTGDQKSIVNTRDEPHADQNAYRRVHVTSGDANMSDYASWLTLVTTSLCLRLVEAGEDLGYLAPEDAVGAMRLWSRDTSLTQTVTTVTGKRLSAIDIQESLALHAKELTDKVDLPKEEVAAITDWLEVCDALRTDPDKLIGRVDWITKRHLINRKLGDAVLTVDTIDRAIQIDYAYDLLEHGYMERLRKTGKGLVTFFTEEEIKAAQTTPPDTRAKQRCKLAKKIRANQINWSGVSNSNIGYALPDPYGIVPPKRTRFDGS